MEQGQHSLICSISPLPRDARKATASSTRVLPSPPPPPPPTFPDSVTHPPFRCPLLELINRLQIGSALLEGEPARHCPQCPGPANGIQVHSPASGFASAASWEADSEVLGELADDPASSAPAHCARPAVPPSQQPAFRRACLDLPPLVRVRTTLLSLLGCQRWCG